MAKYFGYPTAGFYFIPGLGGAAILKEIPKIRHHSFLIWYAGPAAGFTETLLLAAINYFWWHSPLVWQIVFVWSAINIINLLPIIPLDGGMILWSLAGGRDESYLSSFYFFAHMFMSAVVLGLVANPIFAFIVLVFGFSTRKHLIDLWQAGGDRTPMTGRQKLFATMQAVILTFNLLALSVFSGLMIKT